MNQTATAKMEIANLRTQRLQALCGAVLTELGEDPRVPRELLEPIYAALAEVFIRNGAYIMTDKDRDEMGLEPRDFLGWTPSDRVARKQAEQEALLAMVSVVVKPSNKGPEE